VSAPAAPTELAPAPRAPAPARSGSQRRTPRVRPAGAGRALWWPTLLIAASACLVTFHAEGGLNLESMISTEMALTLAAGVMVAASVILAPPHERAYGLWPLGLLLAFTALTAISIVWSVQPDVSWQESGRMFAYSGVFAVGVVLVRATPGRWPALLGGLALAAVAVCGYALLTKVFPSLAPANAYARLNEPYGYWNAVGLTAAMGAICCMWLGARRDGHALLRALAYPAMGLLLLTLVLAYSRGALAALALGLLLWFCAVPLRLRGAALLIAAGLGAAAVAAWDFSRHALSAEGVPLAERATAGHQLGALIAAMLVVLAIVGIASGFLTARRAPSPLSRRRAGLVLLAGIVLVAIVFAGALAHSQRGFSGSITHAFDALTNPNAKPPPNTPGRLTAVASVRARYWKEAFQVFNAHPVLGAGAGGYATAHLRYETQTLEVRHAHGFLVQTLADLGLVGLILALALLLTWLAAAGRATHPFNRRWTSWRAWLQLRSGTRPGWRALRSRELGGRALTYTPERVGMLAMLCLVVVFGAHSLIDWTWYVPGDACVALLCAGWLAGRGELTGRSELAIESTGARASVNPGQPRSDSGPTARARPSTTRLLVAGATLVAALLAMWSQWQPQRSEEARQQAYDQLEAHNLRAANAAAQNAITRDPLSIEALFTLADVQQASNHPALARATLQRAVRLQPSNPQPWLVLGRYELQAGNAMAAVNALQAAIYLNPESISPEAIAEGRHEAIRIRNEYIEALRQAAAASETSAREAATREAATRQASARANTRRAAARDSATLKNASASPARAAARVRRAGRRHRRR
jgi:cytochrome c-type biogenesis protein CcmH/NrfG/O-antigen ligase